ncbi:hemerythrin domain-containing protein [Kineosporia sp. J2-2]|uniref:Hemerythrin domain-containing protein n=1 Tax=Kineosporia corallincola TaxID=2835133 RepID=A0ABS5TDV4_9ACTN|nr:hemerythrin domain-containing protein [Kineosporia corallincola]MBT0768599.1 hemerythrin domain-containing protein [Kineosporia corallincola]
MTTTTATVDTWEMTMAHRFYRREFAVLPAIIRAAPAGDRARARLVGDHLGMVTSALHHHHEAEDDLLWPLMLERVGPDAATVHRMESQHAHLAGLLARLEELNTRWRAEAGAGVRDELADVLAQASAVLDEHLSDEENDLLPLVPGNITVREWDAVMERARQDSGKALGMRRSLVMFGGMLEEAPEAERRRMLAEVPAPVRLVWRVYGRRLHERSRDAVRRG